MSYNYDDILSRHLTSQSPVSGDSTKDVESSTHKRSTSRSRDSSSTRSHRRKTKHSSSHHNHQRSSRSRSRSRSRSDHKRRHRDRDRHRHRPHEADRERSHKRSRASRDRSSSRHHRDRRHGDRSRDGEHTHHHSNSERDASGKATALVAVIGDVLDEKEFAKKVAEELKAKEQAKQKKGNKRKDRLKRLQKLREQKQKEREKEEEKKKDEEEKSPNTDSTVSMKCKVGMEVDVEHAAEANNGCDNNNNYHDDDVISQNPVHANTENIQRSNAEYDEQEDYDIFAQNDKIVSMQQQTNSNKNWKLKRKVSENLNLTHNWDDSEGYYVVVAGDIIRDKYYVKGTSGKGVYSSVLRVEEMSSSSNEAMMKQEYVIKVIRNNEHMKKQGRREISFLREIARVGEEREHDDHCVRLLDSFWYRNHLCLLFEPMKCDLRRLLKSINISHSGLSIHAVYQYTKQLLRALQLLRQLDVIHADIKPDNILVSNDYRTVKLCDFGSSFKCDEVEITPTVGSRYYRAPEIMIGIKWDTQCDIWSLACTLFEIYTTNFLFKGGNNNEMLLHILRLCGLPPLHSDSCNYRNGLFYTEHFNENGDFLESRFDAVAKFDIQIPHKLVNKSHCSSNNNNIHHCLLHKLHAINPTINVQLTHHENKKLNEFANLLSKMLNLNTKKRITPAQALKHPFCVNPIAAAP